jgi:hypothetical protein
MAEIDIRRAHRIERLDERSPQQHRRRHRILAGAGLRDVLHHSGLRVHAAQLGKINVKPSDVKYVVLGHFHVDHAGNVGKFPDATPVIGSLAAPARQPLYYEPIDLAAPCSGVVLRTNSSLAGVFGESGFASGGSGVGFSVPGSCAGTETPASSTMQTR